MSGDNWGDEAPLTSGGGGSDRWVKPKLWPVKNGAYVGIIRLLSGRILFWEGWANGKPIRASYQGPSVPWTACFPEGIVWDYDDKYKRSRTPAVHWGAFAAEAHAPDKIKFWQISQYSIQQALLDLAQSPKGPPTSYPIMVTMREKPKTTYSVQGLDKEPVDPVTAKAYADLLAAGGKLEGILTSEGPFPRSGATAPRAVDDGTIPF